MYPGKLSRSQTELDIPQKSEGGASNNRYHNRCKSQQLTESKSLNMIKYIDSSTFKRINISGMKNQEYHIKDPSIAYLNKKPSQEYLKRRSSEKSSPRVSREILK